MRRTAVLNTTDENRRRGAGAPLHKSRPKRRRTMGLCAHCHLPIEFDQDHLRLYRSFWHVECALAAHEPATE